MSSRKRPVPRLGDRGEGWVVLQFLLLGVLVGCTFVGTTWPKAVAGTLAIVGWVVAGAGLVVFILGFAALGRSLTPFPRPSSRATLRRHGIYRRARHPIYGGLLLLVLGWSLALAPLGLAPGALLAGVLFFKSRSEEGWLLERYPETYPDYLAATRARFFPRLR